MRRQVRTIVAAAVLGCALLLLWSEPARADEASLKELQAKYDRLEKQLQDVTSLLKQMRSSQAASSATPAAPVTPGPYQPADAAAVSGSAVVTPPLDQATNRSTPASPATREFVVGQNLGMTAVWRNGLWLETEDKAFKVHVGGRTQWDAVWYNAGYGVQFGKGGVGAVEDAVNPRRARLEVDGTFWEVIDFFCEYEFLGNTFNADPAFPATDRTVENSPGPTDLWVTLTQIPVLGNLRVGSMKPPVGFEHLTSSRWLNFMERSFAFDAYIGGTNNGFQPGIQTFNWTADERMTWQLGVFKNNQTVFGWNVGDGEYEVAGRMTWLPVYQDNGRYLVHLGLGATHRALDDNVARLRARTLLRNGPFTLQTKLADITVGGDGQTLVVPEFAAVLGPWTFQAEYFGSWIENTTFPAGGKNNFGTTFTQSAYAEILYFLTGESRPYLKKGGSGAAFDRVIPRQNYWFVPGESGSLFSAGAWQVGARFSWIDLDNQGLSAGTLYDCTLGLNWFLNPNMKFQWNYSTTYRNAPGNTSDGWLRGFGMRMAMDF